jgi:hypothetical protein
MKLQLLFLAIRTKRFLNRFSTFTKVLILLVVLDLCAPGWLIFRIPFVAIIDLTPIADAVKGE